jgi:glycosyltransferase involved in cell wall biosynthesis
VVIAAYNEQGAIGTTVASLRETYTHVVVVDDGSSDATAESARQAGGMVLCHLINRGQGAALQTGIDYALQHGAEIVVTFDADGQHRRDDIARLVAPLVRGEADVVLGSRFLEHAADVPAARRALLRAGLLFTRLTSGLRLTDTHNGLRAFSRRAASLMSLRQDRMAHASEILDRIRSHRLRYVEVPTRVLYTDYSRAKGQRARGALRIVFDYFIDKVLP